MQFIGFKVHQWIEQNNLIPYHLNLSLDLELQIQESYLRGMSHTIEITPLLDQTPLDEDTKDELPSRPRLLSTTPAVAASFFAFAVASHRARVKQEGREEDYIIEIKTAEGQDGVGLQANETALQIYDELSAESCTISRVNPGLRESNPDAYTPKLIPIGPYHKDNPKLRSMEKYKLRYKQRFLQRKAGIDENYCIRELETLKDKALKCYDDIENFNSDRELVEMLLLDGCFVIEYIREFWEMIPKGEVKIIKAAWMEILVDRDLLLLENQLPMFVLAKLYEITMDDTDVPFVTMVKLNFTTSLPKVTPKFISEITDGNAKEITHLLQVVHMCCCPSKISKTGLNGNASKKIEHSKTSFGWNPLKITNSRKSPKVITKDDNIWHDVMRSATELNEAGVRFSKVGKIYRRLNNDNEEDATSLFDIKFDNGLMEIPCFEVIDRTETVLRNLIAYEQHSSNVYPKHFSDYVVFMDRLIDSGKDVNLLRSEGILRNRIGDDQEVAIMFNKLGEGVLPSSEFYYKEECRKLIEHCEKPWNKNMAILWHDYLNSPWAKISTAAAIILLLLTAAQTVLAFISTLK